MDYSSITNQEWEQTVGRRNPPLRAYLTFNGFHAWFKKKFNVELNSPFITFCQLMNDGQISADIFINTSQRELISEIISKEFTQNYEKISTDIIRFNEITNTLLKESKKLASVTRSISDQFKTFTTIWENFACAYVAPLFYEKTAEYLIISKHPNKEETQTKLLEIVTGNIDSRLFGIKRIEEQNDDKYFSPKDKKYIAILKELAHTRDLRKSSYEQAWYEHSTKFFEQIGEQTGLGQYVQWVSPEVIAQTLVKPVSEPKYTRQCLIYYASNKAAIDYQTDLSGLKNKVLKIDNTTTLKGQIAYKGSARGKVRIIMPHDKKKILSGEILVTKMTTPDYVPIMKQSAAIITDEGGTTCHAAIISRELQIPCLIGTKFATKILKNGDLIEVDAITGQAKKL